MEILLERLISLWNHWELRVLVLMSFSFQIILTLLGSFRKRTAAPWVIFLLWSAYLLANAVATTALGVLAHNQGYSDSGSHENPSPNLNSQLAVFWSPFLLLHLGGPDAITAFSSEDNELWLRHLFGLIYQLGLAIYVFHRSLVPGSDIWLLTIPMFVAGTIKYGERTWALMSASIEHFRDSVLPDPDPGPDYVQSMEEYDSKKAKGLDVSVSVVPEDRSELLHSTNTTLYASHYFFQTFRRLFFDIILSFHEADDSYSYFQKVSWEVAFNVIETELQFMYDLLYTKVAVIYTYIGSILRFICFSSILSVLTIFVFVIDKRGYLVTDIVITYILLGGALSLEICQVILLLSSHWTMIWLYKHRSHRPCAMVFKLISFLRVGKESAWSNSMAQFNLLSFCFKDKPTVFNRIQQFLRVKEILDKYLSRSNKPVSDGLKMFIFLQLKQKLDEISQNNTPTIVEKCSTRGEWMLRRKNCFAKLGWSIETPFDQSILLWHIATDLCYYLDSNKATIPETMVSKYQAISKVLSDYFLYLLDVRPDMLPTGIGSIRFRDTCADTKRFLHKGEYARDEEEVCTRLHSVETAIEPFLIKGDKSKSVLFDACRLAKSLQEYEIGDKWEIISGVWVEMLSYAASQCKGIYHAKQLSVGGGELLTRVWLLMAHLRMTQQFK